MARKAATSVGTTITTIHAPWVNFVAAMTSVTMPVVTAPTPLMTSRWRQPGSRRYHHRRTIPDCDSVKEMKTPTA